MTDKHQEFWDRRYAESGSNTQSPYIPALHEKIREVLPDDVETILDAGCGGGSLMAFLGKEQKYKLEGVDMSPEGIRVVVEDLHMQGQVGDLTDLHQYADNSFDLVVCSEVTEHLPLQSFEKVVGELFRVARRYVMTTNPFREDLLYHQTECTNCQTRFHPAGHIYSVDESLLRPIFSRHAKSISFLYSGEREWRSRLYSDFLRAFGYRLVGGYVPTCPVCGEGVPFKRWSIPIRLTGYGYRGTQLGLKKLGLHTANHIITLAEAS